MDEQRIVLGAEYLDLIQAKGEAPVWRVAWVEIRQIVAWKEDLLTVDMICMGFRVNATPEYFWCDEECRGWKELEKEIERRFVVSDRWWSKVAFPAFVPNWTSIWGDELGCENIILIPRRPYRGKGFPTEP